MVYKDAAWACLLRNHSCPSQSKFIGCMLPFHLFLYKVLLVFIFSPSFNHSCCPSLNLCNFTLSPCPGELSATTGVAQGLFSLSSGFLLNIQQSEMESMGQESTCCQTGTLAVLLDFCLYCFPLGFVISSLL